METKEKSKALTMIGAEPFLLKGGETGCLLIHGYTGTPFEMRMLGDFLQGTGCTVLAPRLFGHATQPDDMVRARWQDWMASVEDGLNLLKGCTRQQVVMGLSMGGILALLSAARFQVSGVVTFSTPSALPDDPRLMFLPMLYPFYPRVGKGKPDWHNPNAAQDHKEYPYFPTRSLMELNALIKQMRSELDQVTAPAFFVQSHQDKSIPPESMDTLYEHVHSVEKSKLWVENSGHVVIREPEREKIFTEVSSFVNRITGNP